MAEPVTIRVLGLAAPQGSKTRTRHGMRESSKAVGPWREAVRAETQLAITHAVPDDRGWAADPPLAGPLAVSVTFYFGRPQNHYGTGKNAGVLKPGAPAFPASKRNDVDKLSRAVLDGITQGGAIADDGLVTDLTAVKRYADDVPAGAVITIRAVS
jgi:crossover junction endodeoxyribonuclease RusA